MTRTHWPTFEYEESYRDNDIGGVRIGCRVEREGDTVDVSLTIDGDEESGVDYAPFAICRTGLVRRENAIELTPTHRKYRSAGVIERLYARPLVRIRLTDGARLYLDYGDRRFVNADSFFFEATGRGFDPANHGHVERVLQTLSRMAAVLAPEMRPWDATMTEQLQVGLERATDAGGERLELGAAESCHFAVSLQGRTASVLSIQNLPDDALIYANYRRAALGNEEAVVFHGRCFPEHHKALEQVAFAFSIP